MKKIGVIAGVIIIIIVLGILSIRNTTQDTEVTKHKTKVGLILNGVIDDHTWSQSHYEGLEACVDSLNLEVLYQENVPEDENSIFAMEKLIHQGCKIIIANSFGYGEYVMNVAEKYPDIYFYHATGVKESKNIATYFGRIYQMRYLCGIVAGMQTKTNEIGYVAAFPISEVNRGLNAFTLGVRSVNPDAKVYVRFCESWEGDKEAKEAAQALVDAHSIDVITMHSDSLEPLRVADENGIYSISYDMDCSDLFPDTTLTAAIWQWDKFYEPHILECLQGKFRGKHHWEGVETGMVSLAPFTKNVDERTIKKVEEAKKKLDSGLYDVFYGPIIDQEGTLRIKEGENMSDDAMLNRFDWYVEGVVIDD